MKNEDALLRQRESRNKWAKANRDKINAKTRERRASRTEEQRVAEREYRRKYREANADKIKAKNRRCYEKSPETWILSNIKRRCREEGLPCNITVEDIVPPEFCPVLGLRLERNHNGREAGPAPNSPSVDRIIPERGYVKGNVIVVSHMANAIKQNATPFDIRRVADFYEKVIAEVAARELKELSC